jgi:glycosyltransferase involved in cell wall biosynthesis
MQPYRLLVLSSHPIQYQAPMHRALASHPAIDLTVLFCSEWGLKPYRDQGFGREVQWDIPLLGGYESSFLRNWSWRPGLNGFWGLLNPSVVRWIVNRRYDAILVYGWSRATNLIAIGAALASNTPLLLRGETNLLNFLPPFKRRLKTAALKPLFAAISGFLSIGRHNTEFYRAWGVPTQKIHLTPYSVDNDFWLTQATQFSSRKSQLKRDLGFALEIPVILFSGKLISKKRPLDLLRAFEQVSKNHRCGLVFLGDGQQREELQAYANKRRLANVRFVGFKNQTEIAPYFAMSDVFVLPSGFEPWGLVVNEAMCFGLPIIASDKVGAAGDLVEPGVNGFIYPAGDVSALAAHREQLVLSPALRHSAGQASGKLIQKWGIPQVVGGVLECLRRVAGERIELATVAD